MELLPHERALVARLRTPFQVQRWLQSIDYNKGNVGKTLRSFRGVVEHKAAHCLEGALAAAFILQHHGYPPLLLDLGSDDNLDHVNFLWRASSGWGSVGKSRYPALMGRRPVYRTVRDLAWSYVDPFVDKTGRLNGYAVFDLRDLDSDWEVSRRNVWSVERAMLENPHTSLRSSNARHLVWKERYLAWKDTHPDAEPPKSFYPGSENFL